MTIRDQVAGFSRRKSNGQIYSARSQTGDDDGDRLRRLLVDDRGANGAHVLDSVDAASATVSARFWSSPAKLLIERRDDDLLTHGFLRVSADASCTARHNLASRAPRQRFGSLHEGFSHWDARNQANR